MHSFVFSHKEQKNAPHPTLQIVKMYPKLIAKAVFQINFGEAQSMGFNLRVKTMTQKCYILIKNGKSC
jgi:hypothetical protein